MPNKRMNAGVKTFLIFTTYLAGSALTFGYIYTHVSDDGAPIGAMLWPFYWVFRAGIEITRNWTF